MGIKEMVEKLRLGLNIDHVATVRNARGGLHPDPVRAAMLGEEAGVDGITAHLREDRRHIKDADIFALKEQVNLPLNFEMAATQEMQEIALKVKPNAVCLVPEKREELTTEGGLDVLAQKERLIEYIQPLKQANIRISLFVEATMEQVQAAVDVGADIVELHTGTYVHACQEDAVKGQEALARLKAAASFAHDMGLEVHAGHGLDYQTVGQIAAIESIIELNIGHFLMGEAMMVGMEQAIKVMRQQMDEARG